MNILIMDMGSRMNLTGGQARFAALLHRYFTKTDRSMYLGFETIFTNSNDKNAIFLKRTKALGPDVKKSKLSENAFLRLAYNFLILRHMRSLGISKSELAKRVSDFAPDVILSNSIQDMPVIRFLKKKGLSFKTIYVDHTCISNSSYGYFSKEGIPLTVGTGIRATSMDGAKRQLFNFFDMNIALNMEQLRNITEFTSKVRHIPIGVDPAVEDPEKSAELRKRYSIPRDAFVILYLGRMFERQKSISTLIKAFKMIKGNLVLFAAGEGPSLPEYKELAGDDKRIIFAGRIDEKDKHFIYGMSDLFALTSNWEGFTRTPLEAATHSVPLVLSTGSYIEDLREKGIGEIPEFKTGDVEGLKAQIERIMKDKDYRKHAIEVSRQIAKRFKEDDMLETYRDTMLRLLSKK